MRLGFTLFEVGISLVLIALGVLTLAMFLPVGIKAQQKARFEVYAGAKALDMVETFLSQALVPSTNSSAGAHSRPTFLPESSLPWDSTAGYRVFAPDIEAVLAAPRYGIYPVPRTIAERLTSANDEIRRILEAGGNLYYANPLPTHGIKPDTSFEVKPPSEAQKLLFAVTGYAQQNALRYLPWKSWPYYIPYPSPPMVGVVEVNGTIQPPWDQLEDADVAFLYRHDFAAFDGTAGNNRPRQSGLYHYTGAYDGAAYTGYTGSLGVLTDTNGKSQVNYGEHGWLASKHFLALALWYAQRKGVPDLLVTGQASAADRESVRDNPDVIRAMRYLAFAGLVMTKWYAQEEVPALPERSVTFNISSGQSRTFLYTATPALPGLRLGVPIPGDEGDPHPIDPANQPKQILFPNSAAATPRPRDLAELFAAGLPAIGPPIIAGPRPDHPRIADFAPGGTLAGHFFVTQDMIVNWHETAVALANDFIARRPYNWSVQRNAGHATMMDHPLIQWDLVDSATLPRLSGTITGTDGAIAGGPVDASQWRPIAAQPIESFGRTATGDAPNWSSVEGDLRHFSLTAPFTPAERCRQIVFWMVDWQSYEDFETAPSAPVDASRYPRDIPGRMGEATSGRFVNRYMGMLGQSSTGNPTVHFFDRYQPGFRNPEKAMLFQRSMANEPTGSNIRPWTIGPDLIGSGQTDEVSFKQTHIDRPDYGGYLHSNHAASRVDPRAIFSGLFGADRNWNQILDRGPIPASVRLRAIEVARFNCYDPRLVVTLR